jgi:rubrerythrin
MSVAARGARWCANHTVDVRPKMLTTDIHTPSQLLSAALTVERTNSKHYADLAARMQYYGKHETVKLFERLVSESLERESQFVEWAQLEGVELTESSEEIVWEDPLMPTTYDAEARDPYRSTPYKALAYAAHNTDRAFHMYAHICAMAEDPQTERYAQILAGDALNRSRLLQSRRRRAYQLEQRGPWQKHLDLALTLTTVDELYAMSVDIHERLLNLFDVMCKHYADLHPVKELVSENQELCRQKTANAISPASIPPPPYDLESIGDNLHEDMLLTFTEFERAFIFYDTVIGHAFDEDIMLAAQDLSEFSLNCLEAIRIVQKNHGVPPAA